MALFPAFAGSSDVSSAPAKTEFDWLSNKSFCTEDAVSLHQRSLQTAPPPHPHSPPASRSSVHQFYASEDDSAATKRKKRRKKKKKHKQYKKSSCEDDDESSDSETRKREVDGSATSDSRVEARISAPSRAVFLDDIQSVVEETFRIDRRADPANWEYKSLYRGDIARYNRKGRSCLGIDSKKQQISWEDTHDKRLPRRKPERYYSKAALQTLRNRADPISCPTGTAEPSLGHFIPVRDCDPNASSLPTSWVNPLGVYDASTTMWLEGKGGPVSSSPQLAPRDSSVLGKVEDYNHRLRENPGDVHTWMEYVSFQDELVTQPSMYSSGQGEGDGHHMSVKLVLEKKLSILERAIESNPGSIELKLARLQLCSEFWEAAALLKEWQKLIFLHPNEPQLWHKYLLFTQSQFSTFSVSKVNATYGKCLSTLAAVQDGSMLSHPALPGTEGCMYDLFLQQCHFLRQAGHCEKAVSLFQALLDFTFYKPDSVKDMSTKEQVDFFEPFWDSGEPRFGEKGAKGWNSWMRQQERGGWIIILDNQGEEEDDEADELDVKDKSRPRNKIWLDMECFRESRHWLPWRPDAAKKQTEEDCEDPERQVLFDDLGPSMLKISSPVLKFQLILSFLQFLGVPCGSRLPPTCLYLSLDEASVFDHITPYERLLTTFELPLSGVSAVGHMDTMSKGRRQISRCKDGENFIQNVFQSALSVCRGEEKRTLSVCWLQYEICKVVQCLQANKRKLLKSQGKRSKRLAKGLLREPCNRNMLALWKEYALLEWLLGNAGEARKVFDAAIGLAGSRGLKDQELCDLCLLYAELEAEALDNLEGSAGSRAVHILTSLADQAPYTPYSGHVQAISILKARKAFERVLEDFLTLPLSPVLVSLSGCFALFQYLTVGVEPAVSVLKQVLDSQLPPAALCDEVQVSYNPLQTVAVMHTNLLRYHSKVSVYPRTSLRDTLMAALRLYPNNPTLWRSYIQTESRSHNISQARRFIDSVRRTTDSLEPYLFAIRAEEDRKTLLESVQRVDIAKIDTIMPETGLSNRIKSLFEHCMRTEAGSRCLLLWRMYLHFTVSLGQRDRSRGLFYKAIQSCPWAKVLYLDAAEYFPELMSDIIDLMTEKELRVRVPLEELELLLED